jgi:lysophospholipase L1-like esterase
MTTIDLRPAEYNIHEIAGADLSLVITCFEADGTTPLDVSGYTFAADVLRAGEVVDSFADAVTGVDDNVLTLTLTDTETAAIGTGRGLEWALKVTASGSVDWWYAGEFRLYNPGTPRDRVTSTEATAVIGGSITASLTVGVPAVDVAANVSVADAGGFYTGTDVEAALAELGQFKADVPAQYAPWPGAGVARFVKRAQSGEDLSITCIGDSILEGQTVTEPSTDGAMILVAADLSTRFGITVTQTNNADSGATAATAHIDGDVSAAIADNADLYIVSAFDKNDLGADGDSEPYAPGYPAARSTAAVERIIRAIRTDVPKADIIVMSTNPYVSGSASNALQQAKDALVRQVAAAYGCEWVDCYAAFVALGDYSSYMGDSTHPNTAGHRLIADTILAQIPDAAGLVPTQPGAVASFGVYDPENVDPATAEYGYAVVASPATLNGVTYTLNGTWVSEVSTTPGDYLEVSGDCIEFLVQLSTSDEDDAVVDISIDGGAGIEDVALNDLGKKGNYWCTFATGLAPGSNHSVRLTLVSGTLRTFAVAGLASGVAQFRPETIIQSFTLTHSAIDTGGGYTEQLSATLTLPSGWNAAVVTFCGGMSNRVQGATTTTERQFNNQIVVGASTIMNVTDVILPTAYDTRSAVPLSAAVTITANATVKVRTRMLSTDKGNCRTSEGNFYAVLTRSA